MIVKGDEGHFAKNAVVMDEMEEKGKEIKNMLYYLDTVQVELQHETCHWYNPMYMYLKALCHDIRAACYYF